MFLYKVGEPHTHVDGYPKSVKEELGLEGPIDAAFMCNDQNTTHVIKGETASQEIPDCYEEYRENISLSCFL